MSATELGPMHAQTSFPTNSLARPQAAFGKGPVPVGELVAAGLGGARSRAIAFKAIADGLPPQYRLRTRLVRAPYPQANLCRNSLAPCSHLLFIVGFQA